MCVFEVRGKWVSVVLVVFVSSPGAAAFDAPAAVIGHRGTCPRVVPRD
jgi:hypothetical protein